nr:sigma factor [Brevibacillus laterosporus]
MGHQQDREDVMNEIYMQMWTSLANYDTNRPFQFWLTRLGNPSSAEISGQELEEIPNF